MPFSTKSYLAGVGTVVAAVTIGFSGGFFLAPSTDHADQNRLQRVTSSAPISSPAPQAAATPKLEITEASAAPASAIPPPPRMIPVMAKAVEPEQPAVMAKAPEPDRAPLEQGRNGRGEVNTEKKRAAEVRAEERKRAREQRSAERRKQREIALATVAVKRMLRDGAPQQVADRTESPRFGFFGED